MGEQQGMELQRASQPALAGKAAARQGAPRGGGVWLWEKNRGGASQSKGRLRGDTVSQHWLCRWRRGKGHLRWRGCKAGEGQDWGKGTGEDAPEYIASLHHRGVWPPRSTFQQPPHTVTPLFTSSSGLRNTALWLLQHLTPHFPTHFHNLPRHAAVHDFVWAEEHLPSQYPHTPLTPPHTYPTRCCTRPRQG